MHLQGVQTALEVGAVHNDPPVKAAGTKQSLVQNLRAVGGGQAHDALGGVEAVNFTEQLVQGLLLLGVAAQTVVPGAAHGVNFVDEDDAGGHLRRLLEQVADAACAHAHEHLHKVGAGDIEEGDIGLAGHGLGKQGLAGTGGAHQKSALGKLGADGGVFLGVVEEVNNLLQGLLGLVLTGHVLEGDAGLLFHEHLGLGLAEAAHHALAAHAAGHQVHHQEQSADHDDVGQDHHNHGVVLHDDPVHRYAHVHQILSHGPGVGAVGQAGIAGLLLGGRFGSLLLGHVDDPVRLNLHLGKLSCVPGGHEV